MPKIPSGSESYRGDREWLVPSRRKSCTKNSGAKMTIPVFSPLPVRAHKINLKVQRALQLARITCLAAEASSHLTDFPSSYHSAPNAVLQGIVWSSLRDVQGKRMLDAAESLHPFIV